ncbi:TPA: lipid-A-disaccharide synthase [Legionella pneumophila]|nr:lipid-A-disaccharide synthase [Legionella pneumophila]HCJ1133016.1 lipid-A-disaccharide synthase [Legionella pneumophila]HCJ4216875.1 lipid-A-disaccharide synthase [Legionella pneumophila]HCJ4226331.1 lipid-A-disaccharide synthase [Legionella pneumophila]HEL9655526.1 lipid-A-disaccharide synthase [Legionella pneumophila]
MPNASRVVIVAGEESGDHHAAELVKQLKAVYPNLEISGIGGKHLRAAGVHLISDLTRYAVTGLTEIIPFLKIFHKAFQDIKQHLSTQKPDLLILVDYPAFNLRLAKYAKKKLGLKIIYYISPQIWAWKGKRIHLIKDSIDKMAVIFPFEKTIYENAGVPVSFVGHPLVKKIASAKDKHSSRTFLGLPLDEPIIALLPGSRHSEIERHIPILVNTAKLLTLDSPKLRFVVPIAGTINPDKVKAYFSNQNLTVTFIQGQAIECMSAADFVIVASGTASLECALLEKPMCIIYKSSFLTYVAAMYFIKVKFLGLCNLLANKMMVPEFLQYDCNPIELSRYISNFHNDPNQPKSMINQLAKLKESLSSSQADCSLFDLVVAELPEKNA